MARIQVPTKLPLFKLRVSNEIKRHVEKHE